MPHARYPLLVSAVLVCATSSMGVRDRTYHNSDGYAREFHRGTWGAPPHNEAAFMIPFAEDDTDNHYFNIVLASIHCLQETGTPFPIVLLHDAPLTVKEQSAFDALNVSRVIRYPEDFLARGIDLSGIENMTAGAREQHWFWRKNWNKLAAWTLTEYKKLVIMDADIIAIENSDALFQYPELSAVPDLYWQTGREGYIDTFNGGMLVIEPNMITYDKMMHLLSNGYDAYYQEQGFLNDLYNRSWHALPLPYNMAPALVEKGIPGLKVNVFRMIHFVGESACGECNLGFKTREECDNHVCQWCCQRFVQCKDEALKRVNEYRAQRGIVV